MGRTWQQNSNVTRQRLSRGVRHDMLYGVSGAFFLLMRGIHRFISKIMLQKSKQTSISKNYEFLI